MPFAVVRVPCAARWYFTSPVPPSGSAATASIVRSPSNSRRMYSYGIPIVCASTFSRPRCAMPEHDLVRARLGGELDRLVEHRDHHVEPLERELLLAEEALAQEALHPLHLAEPAEERLLLLGGERLPVAARLDRLAQPDALLVVGEVLELVGDRAAVGLRELRQDVGERLARDVHAQDRRGDARLQLGRQLRLEAQRLERRVADRLRAERVEPGREVPVRAVRLDERHRGRDAAEQLRRPARPGRRGREPAPAASCAGRSAWPLPPAGRGSFSSSRAMPGVGRDELGVAALEERAPLRRHRLGVLEVLVEQGTRVAGVQAVDVMRAHPCVVPGACGLSSLLTPRRAGGA